MLFCRKIHFKYSNQRRHGVDCFTKQRLACIRLMYRINRTHDIPLTQEIATWSARRKKGVGFYLNNFINYINVSVIVNGISIVTKTVMETIKERLTHLDKEEFVHELFND